MTPSPTPGVEAGQQAAGRLRGIAGRARRTSIREQAGFPLVAAQPVAAGQAPGPRTASAPSRVTNVRLAPTIAAMGCPGAEVTEEVPLMRG
jgi:hypothetical protein